MLCDFNSDVANTTDSPLSDKKTARKVWDITFMKYELSGIIADWYIILHSAQYFTQANILQHMPTKRFVQFGVKLSYFNDVKYNNDFVLF